MTLLEPDRDQIEIFADAMFRHAGADGSVSLRSFTHENKPFGKPEAIGLNNGLMPLFDAAEDRARRAAQARERVVFCPPVAAFSNPHHATEKDILEGPALSVELDTGAQGALVALEGVLGPATAVIRSGGRWTDPQGQQHDKLHAHWRLAVPARGVEQLAKLKQARSLAAGLVGGDPSNKTIVHPLRWPGSWHRKGEPRLCEIAALQPDAEIDLDTALTALQAAAVPTKPKPATPDGFDAGDDREDWGTHFRSILAGENFHDLLIKLAAKMITAGTSDAAAVNMLRGLFACAPGPRNERWQSRYDDIPRAVSTARAKYQKPDRPIIFARRSRRGTEWDDFQEIKFVVEDFVAEGLTLFAGKPEDREVVATAARGA